MKEAIKIQINSLEALERLIGGDSELEIQIRNNVVQDFTAKHLKALATNDMIKQTGNSVIEQLRRDFFIKKSGRYTWDEKYVFKDGILDEFKAEISIKAKAEIEKTVQQILNENVAIKNLNDAVERAANRIAESLTDENLEKRLDYMVDKKIKEKLGV